MLRRVWRPTLFLAIPGVLITTLAIAAAASFIGKLPIVEALLLGAILSATDPIAVVATFRALEIPSELAVIVEAESLFNDGVAASLYGVLAIAATAPVSHEDLLGIAANAIKTSFGGAAMGFAIASLIVLALRGVKDRMLEIVATVVGAYGAYLAADHFHFSGIFAALVTGMALRAFHRFPSDDQAQIDIDRFWGVLAFVANALVFLLLGLRIELHRTLNEPITFAATLAAVVLSRVAIAYLGMPLLRMGSERRSWQHAIVLAGMRGALSLALALALPQQTPFRAEIIDIVLGTVTATLVVQGLAIGPILARLRL